MRDMVPSKRRPMISTVSGTAILLRQYFFALRLLEVRPYVIGSLDSVRNLLNGVESARECPLVRVKMVPDRLDGVYFCRALGEVGTIPKQPRRVDRKARTSAKPAPISSPPEGDSSSIRSRPRGVRARD